MFDLNPNFRIQLGVLVALTSAWFECPLTLTQGVAPVFRDQRSLAHRLSAESLEVPMSEGLRGTAVTAQFSSTAAAAASSFVLGGGVLGRGTVIPAREAKQAAVFRCLLAPCRYTVHPPHKQLFQHTTRHPSAIRCRGCSRDSMF